MDFAKKGVDLRADIRSQSRGKCWKIPERKKIIDSFRNTVVDNLAAVIQQGPWLSDLSSLKQLAMGKKDFTEQSYTLAVWFPGSF